MPAHPRAALAVVIAATLALFAAPPSLASADFGCERFASPGGSNANPGTKDAPVRSIARLIAITGAGQDGCLPAGSTFVEPIGSFIVDNAGGEPGSAARIRTDDPNGATAVVKGAMWLKAGVHDLSFERIRFTDSPGNNDKGTMLVVHGDRIAFRQTEMTWRRGICLSAGYRDGYARGDTQSTASADGLTIESSRIHDCGNDPEIVSSLRAGGQSGVHGLYLINARGARVHDNHIYDNVSRGIQLWPDVDGAVVEHNVLDGNGSNVNIGSSAAYGHFSEGNRFEANIVSNAKLRSVYDGPWGPGDTHSVVGHFPADGNTRGNLFAGNCIFQADAALAYGGTGYARSGDVFGDPRYLSPGSADFRLAPDSPCTGAGPRAGVEGNPTQREPEPAPPVAPPPPDAQSPAANPTGEMPVGAAAATAQAAPPAPAATLRRATAPRRRCSRRSRHRRRGRAVRSRNRLRSRRRACRRGGNRGVPHRAVSRQGRNGGGL